MLGSKVGHQGNLQDGSTTGLHRLRKIHELLHSHFQISVGEATCSLSRAGSSLAIHPSYPVFTPQQDQAIFQEAVEDQPA